MLLIGISPIVAPLFGSYITATMGWQYIFLILVLISLAMLIAVILIIPETMPAASATNDRATKTYLHILREPQFYKYAISSAFSASCFYVYLAGSPMVFMKIYGMSPTHYSAVFAVLAAGLIGASQMNNLLLKKHQSIMILKRTNLLRLFIALVFYLFCIIGNPSLTAIIIMMFFILSCQGFTGPKATALSLAPFSRNAGRASALLGAMQTLTGGLAFVLLNFLNVSSALPLAGAICCFSFLSFAILHADNTGRKLFRLKVSRTGSYLKNIVRRA